MKFLQISATSAIDNGAVAVPQFVTGVSGVSGVSGVVEPEPGITLTTTGLTPSFNANSYLITPLELEWYLWK